MKRPRSDARGQLEYRVGERGRGERRGEQRPKEPRERAHLQAP